jgi:hypothetical protein
MIFAPSLMKKNCYLLQIGIATRLRDGRPGFNSFAGAGNFSLRHRVQTGSGARGTGVSSSGGIAAGS